MIRTISLAKLIPSTRNVRRSSEARADAELRADIAARGLLQNLIVTPAKKRGSFAVEAGGRRLAALRSLSIDGLLPKDFEVPCLVLDGIGTQAAEASLAENFQRLALNPCDECLAFKHFIDQGSDVEGVAKRFGLTVRFVEGRLRLAGLAPVVFDALDRGDITLDVAKAYASTPDQERQAHVFAQLSSSYSHAHPDSIRRMMIQVTVPGNDPRARFVGEDTYLAAGGRVERDLFDDDETARWLDVAIVEQLAGAKLKAEAETLREAQGFAWVMPTLDRHVGWAQTEHLRRVQVERPEPSDEDREELDRLETAYANAVAVLEDEAADDQARTSADDKVAKLEAAVDAIVNKPPVLPDEMRTQVGTFLLLDGDGRPKLHDAYFVEKQELETVDEDTSSGGEGSEAESGPSGKPAGLSQRLTDELATQRRDILAVHVAANPEFALDLAIFVMVDGGYGDQKGSSLSASAPPDPIAGFTTPDASAVVAMKEVEAGLDRSWRDVSTLAERFDAFRLLAPEARAAWLGHAIARTLKASVALPGPLHCTFHDHLAALLEIDVAAWWRPTATNYFDRVTRAVMLDALTEIEGPALAARYASGKKAELAAACEKICSGDFIGEVGTKDAAQRWLPAAMRFAPAQPDNASVGQLPEDAPPADTGDEVDIEVDPEEREAA